MIELLNFVLYYSVWVLFSHALVWFMGKLFWHAMEKADSRIWQLFLRMN